MPGVLGDVSGVRGAIGSGDGRSGDPGRSPVRGVLGEVALCSSMLLAMFDWPSFLYEIVTSCPVIVARPAAPLEPAIFVASSYLNFMSGPAAVFTVTVFVFVSTSFSSPVIVVFA